MVLTYLTLGDFRNFAASEIALGPGLTIIEGSNGQGKSNLLEAAFLFGTLHPLRARSLGDLVRFGAGGFRLQGTVDADGRAYAVAGDGLRRHLFAGASPASAGRWTPEGLRSVAFLPEGVALAAEGGEPRRRYLDGLAAAVVAGHAAALAGARRVVVQRAHALSAGNGAEAWEEPPAGPPPLCGRRSRRNSARPPPPRSRTGRRPRRWPNLWARPAIGRRALGSVSSALTGTRCSSWWPARTWGVTPRGGRSARWPWPCGRPRPRSCSGTRAPSRCSWRTTCCPSWTRDDSAGYCGGRWRPPQVLLTTAEASRALAGVEAARRYRVEAGRILRGA